MNAKLQFFLGGYCAAVSVAVLASVALQAFNVWGLS